MIAVTAADRVVTVIVRSFAFVGHIGGGSS